MSSHLKAFLVICSCFIAVSFATPCFASWNITLDNAQDGVYMLGQEAHLVIRNERCQEREATPSMEVLNERKARILEIPSVECGRNVVFDLPTSRLGYFEVRPVLSADALNIKAAGSHPSGFLSYAVVRQPVSDKAFTERFFGLQGSAYFDHDRRRGFDIYPLLGVESVGLNYQWSRLEPEPDSWVSFDRSSDKMPPYIKSLGLYPHFSLAGIPTWAADKARLPTNELSDIRTLRLPAQDLQQYERYLTKVVQHIVESYSYASTRTYEIAWEPVPPWGWYGSTSELVEVFKRAHRIIHSLDPQGEIAGPTLANLRDIDLYVDLLRAGLGNYIDVVSFHPYTSFPPDSVAIGAAISRIRNATKDYTGRTLPIIGTEFGYQEGVAGDPLRHAYASVKGMLIFKGEGLRTHTAFYLTDFASEPGYGIMYNLISGEPFGPSVVAPKPAFPMLRAAADILRMTDAVGRMEGLVPGLEGYIFRSTISGELSAAVWAKSDEERSVTLFSGSSISTVLDSFGNIIMKVPANESRTVLVGESPVYITAISPNVYDPAVEGDILKQETWKLYRGQSVDRFAELRPEIMGANQRYELTVSSSSQAFPPAILSRHNFSESALHYSLKIDRNAALGAGLAYLRLTAPNGGISVTRQPLEVMAEVGLPKADYYRRNGHWQLSQTVRNDSPYYQEGTLEMLINGTRVGLQPLKLGASKEARFEFVPERLPSAVRKSEITAIFRTASGSKVETRTAASFLVAERVTSTPDWSRISQINLSPANGTAIWREKPDARYGGADDLSAHFSFAFDDAALYSHFDVVDDIHVGGRPPGLAWQADSLQLVLDLAPRKSTTGNAYAEALEQTSSEFTFYFDEKGSHKYVQSAPATGPLRVGTASPESGITLTGGRDESRKLTVYNVTIPWSVLLPKGMFRPTEIRIGAAVNDSDGNARDRRGIELFGGVISGKGSDRLGSMWLYDN